MKKIFLSLTIVLCYYGLSGQTLVWDAASMEALAENHKMQYAAFNVMKDKEAAIAGLQKSIASKMVQIEYFQSKFYKSLKSVEAIIKTGKDIIYAGDIVIDIGKYQKEMIEYAIKDPELIIVALETQAQLVKRTADLMEYIYTVAIIGTDVNLMDNKQRLDLLKHVIQELRIMRGLAYSITRIMRTALRNGVLQTLMPGQFKYKYNGDKLVEQVLDDFKINR